MNTNFSICVKKHVYIKYILLLVGMSGVGSCNDGFFDTVPNDRLSSATFWVSEHDFNTALNGAYDRMMGVNLDPMYFDGATEIGYSHGDWIRQHTYVMGRANALSGWSADIWARLFTGISRSNEILTRLQESDEISINQEVKERIEAQALFLRGYFYHELLWMFGGVPIFTKVPSVEESREISRASREEVYDQIISDLSLAMNNLPEKWPSDQFGRATKGAAMSYIVRTSLYEGSWQKVHEKNESRANELFYLAAKTAEEIMEMGIYTLHSDFRSLFMYSGESSDEIILSYQKVSGQNGWHAWHGFAPKSMGSEVEIAPTRELVDRFPMKDGFSITESEIYDPNPPRITYDESGSPVVETLGMYENRDPRFYGTILFPGQEFNGVIYNSYPSCGSGAPSGYCSPTADRILITDYNNTYTGYIAMKYLDPQDQSAPTNSGLNFIKMRYADILLMYAEAKAELGEVDESVNRAIGQIRDRVNLPLPHDLTELTSKDVVEFIRNERVIELAWEGLHLADIRRWGVAEDVLNGLVHGIDIASGDGSFKPVPSQHRRSFSAPRNYLWPIPASERDLNPNLVQNPGY